MEPTTAQTLSSVIRQQARLLGFDACGFAKASSLPDFENKLALWLQKGYHGTMGYMQNNIEKRVDPTRLVDGAVSVIALAHNYFPVQEQHPDAHYKVSKYAYGLDYHTVLKKKLFLLLDFIRQHSTADINARVFTDSAPVPERAWATMAGLGATGKNSCLILPGKGSFFFLAEIIINVELGYDEPYTRDLCGSCTRCMQACPTGAITSAGVIDSTKCISYLTIESREDIPMEFAGKFNNWIFGCDICQDACPHNRFAKPHDEPGFDPLPYIKWTKEQWEGLTKETYNRSIKNSGSPLSRASFEKLSNNISFHNIGTNK